MLLFNPNKQNLDEVVFEKRNISYGAYALRKAYPSRVNKSLIFTLLPFVLVVGITLLNHPIDSFAPLFPDAPKPKDRTIVCGGVVEVMSGFELELANAEFVIVPDKKIPEKRISKPEVKKMVSAVIRSMSGTGSSSASMGGIGLPGLPGGIPSGLPIIGGTKEPEILDASSVGVMAEFPGGLEAMYAYIQKHLNYPRLALENGVQGKVVVSFVIMPDGKVDMSNIERGVGFGCDEEALRVINEMPTWEPALQNGRKVAVRLILPIVFQSN
jgi:protein TonB